MSFWNEQRVVVTGGAGFLGSYVVEALAARGCPPPFVPRKADYDLVRREAVQQLLADARPTLIFHLAAAVGGIGANQQNPGRFFYENLMMGVQLLEEARLAKVPKVVIAGTVCAYPKHTPVPFREESLWDGYPEETNAPYGLAKKMLLVQSQAYRAQYGFRSVFLLPANLYGPRDNFDPSSSHVIPALIRKVLEAQEAGRDELVVWGDGSPTREFLYAQDAAEGFLLAAERYEGDEPINLGTGEEIRIRDLAQQIAELSGFRGRLAWDGSRPNGQPRRHLSTARAERLLGFRARTSLRDGLSETLAWYRTQRRGS